MNSPPPLKQYLTDAALITRIRAGDRDAADTLVRRYYDVCWQFAYRMTGHRADAEDAVQDTFLRALRSLNRYQEQQRFRAWLFCILTNRCRTVLVRRRRGLVRFVTDDQIDYRHEEIERQLGSASDGHESYAHDSAHPPAELADALQRALGQLGSRYREAFLLKHAEELEYTQMAEITGASISALKMRVKRACETLRLLLEEDLHA